MKKFNVGKIWHVIKSLLNIVITLFIVLFLIVVCLQRFSNNRLSFFNYRMFDRICFSFFPQIRANVLKFCGIATKKMIKKCFVCLKLRTFVFNKLKFGEYGSNTKNTTGFCIRTFCPGFSEED